MANWSFVTRTHLALYRASGGRIGARLAGLEMLLLGVRGRKSGRLYTVPLACFPDGDDRVVVASNNGQDHDPGWLANLTANPEVQVRLGRKQWRARGFVADSQRRARLWPELKRLNRAYASYEKKTRREIPVVILERLD
jgi:deazaflavin-dependent oxidoreductase (nitroreductase family)